MLKRAGTPTQLVGVAQSGWLRGRSDAVFEAPAVVASLDDIAVMREAIEQGMDNADSQDRGEVQTTDAQQAAKDLISLGLGLAPLRPRFNELPPMSEGEIMSRVVHGVAVYMKMYRAGD